MDTAISSLSLGPGHNPTESLVEMLEGTGYTTHLDKQRLLNLKRYFKKVRPRYAEFLSDITGVETEIFDSQIPGGMISNMESQLKQQGAGDRMQEVLDEVPRVRKDAGYPPLVTPSSQIVGTQAVFNVLLGRYKVLSAEFADLMLGTTAKPLGRAIRSWLQQAEKQAKKPPIEIPARRPAETGVAGAAHQGDRTSGLRRHRRRCADVLDVSRRWRRNSLRHPGPRPKNLGKDPGKGSGGRSRGSARRSPVSYQVNRRTVARARAGHLRSETEREHAQSHGCNHLKRADKCRCGRGATTQMQKKIEELKKRRRQGDAGRRRRQAREAA